MTCDDIIRMAKNEYGIYAFTAESLAHFVVLVAAAEREACAELCDELVERNRVDAHAAWVLGNSQCAAAIRARGEQA
jgi:hypothetical protein